MTRDWIRTTYGTGAPIVVESPAVRRLYSDGFQIEGGIYTWVCPEDTLESLNEKAPAPRW
jgi:hypothetical protein